jgi:hypothetical protein
MVLGYLVFGEIDGMVECLGSTACCFVPLFCSSCLFCFGQFEEGFGFCIGWLLCFVLKEGMLLLGFQYRFCLCCFQVAARVYFSLCFGLI